MSATATNPETKITLPELKVDVNPLLEKAKAFAEISTPLEYEQACDVVKGFAQLEQAITAETDPIVTSAFRTHRMLTGWRDGHLSKVREAKDLLRRAITKYMNAAEQKRKEEEARLRKQETDRLAEEARQRQDEERVEAAIEAEQSGDTVTAEAIMNTAPPAPVVVTPPIVLQSTTVPQKGVVMRKTPKYRIVDENKIPREYLMVDEAKIGKIVRAMGEQAQAMIPGIEVYMDSNVAISGK